MPDALPYMKLWVSDLLGDPAVGAMDEAEFGLYMRALVIAWSEGSIPADHDERAKLLRLTPERLQELWPAIERKWDGDGNGGLVNPRQERERNDAVKTHAKRVKAGRKGGKARRGQW